VIRKTTEVVGTIKGYDKPRQVHRGQKPELIIRGSAVTFNGNPLKLGSSIAEWEKTLGKSSRLKEGGSDINTWDEFGIITYRLPSTTASLAPQASSGAGSGGLFRIIFSCLPREPAIFVTL
jgi:hypothetical protein